jgi:putative endonuclease
METFYVYILTNSAGVLYIGVTNDMGKRLWEHVHDRVHGFASQHNLDRLIYFETFPTATEAIAREKQLKGWRREKKTALIATINPSWRDMSGRFPYAIPADNRNSVSGPSTAPGQARLAQDD